MTVTTPTARAAAAIIAGQEQFLKKHKLAFKVEKMTDDYYMTRSLITKPITFFLSAIFFLPVLSKCQDKNTVCQQLHDGIYYYYPKNSASRFECHRQGHLQREIDLNTGDSAIWEVNWEGACVYSLTYISGSMKMQPKMIKFYKRHKQVFRIDAVTEDYYTYTSFIDEISTMNIKKDTLWLHEKEVITDNELFQLFPDEASLQREGFSDSSQYAVLYLYRPGKFTNSALTSFVYCNDNLMWISKNRSGCLVKIMKEGPLELKSRRYYDESVVKLNVIFGKKYFVKSLDHWNLSGGRLEIIQMDPKEGWHEFEEATVR